MIVVQNKFLARPHSYRKTGKPTYRGDKTRIKEQFMKMKYADMGNKPFLLVPVIDERPTQVPIGAIDTLVFGYLLFLSRKGNDTTRTAVATTLRLDKKAVDRAVAVLVDGGCVVEEGARIRAVKPTGVSQGWFRQQAEPTGEEWWEGFIFDRVFLPRWSTTLSVRTNLLFWHLVKLGHPVNSMPGYHKVGGDPNSPPKFLTVEYLARALRCYRKTVTRGLQRLQELNLITIQFLGRKKFVVGIPPIETQVRLWRDSWGDKRGKEVAVEVTADSLFGLPSRDILKPSVLYDAGAGRYIRGFGIKGKVAEEIVTKIVKYRIEPRYWQAILEEAHRDHAKNREKNPQLPKHCGHLFKHMLEEFVQTEEVRRRIQGERSPMGYAEATATPLIISLRMTKQAERLLYHALRVEHLELRGGGVVPCRLNWEIVLEFLKQAGGDFHTFKRGIAESVFDFSGERPACDWLDQWLAIEQIPVQDDSPMTALGLDSKERRLIRGHATLIAQRKVDAEDEVAFKHLVNNLIRLACWQAPSKSQTAIETSMNTVSRVLFPRKETETDILGDESPGSQDWSRKLGGYRTVELTRATA